MLFAQCSPLVTDALTIDETGNPKSDHHEGGILVRHTANMTANGQNWTGDMTFEIYNENDVVVFAGTGSGTATRLNPLPLSQ